LLIERHASLMEADEEILSELEHVVPSWFKVYGWDDMALRKKALDLGDESIREEAEIRRRSYSPGSFMNMTRAKYLWEESYRIAMLRNTSLKKTIEVMERRLQHGNKLFVIAGSDHWTEDVNLQKWLKKYRFSIIIQKGSNY